MDKQSPLNLLKVAGGISTFSGIGHGLFYLLGKFSSGKTDSLKLSPWLESYIKEVEIKLKESKNKFQLISKEAVACVINLLGELEEFLYLKNCKNLEEKRIKILENPEQYESAVFESLEQHEKYFTISKNYLKKRLRVNFEAILDCVNNLEINEIKNLLEENQKEYDDLPSVDNEVLMRIYIQYINHHKQHKKVAENLFLIAEENNDYYKVAIEICNLNRYLLKDMILKQYKLNEKYLYQLMNKKGLMLIDQCLINDQK